jgi:SAM-dependent methyltransferase
LSDSDRNWKAWGEQDPYFAVLSETRFCRANLDETRDEFFESGRGYVAHALHVLERHFGPVPNGRALDFGCGVGRLTIPLSERFTSVIGLDVAPAMLEEAGKNSTDLAIDYRLSDDRLSTLDGQFDYIISCIVLQHIPVKRGMLLLDGLLSRISISGGCTIHLSIQRRLNWFGEARYWMKHRMPGGLTLFNLLRGRHPASPAMQMNEYPLPEVIRLFHARGFPELVLHYGDHGGFDTVTITSVRRI